MTKADATDPVAATRSPRPPSVAELQRDIEETRDELAATVAALAAKANLPARARERFGRMRTRGRGRTDDGASLAREGGDDSTSSGAHLIRQGVMLAVAVGAAAVVAWLLMRRKRG